MNTNELVVTKLDVPNHTTLLKQLDAAPLRADKKYGVDSGRGASAPLTTQRKKMRIRTLKGRNLWPTQQLWRAANLTTTRHNPRVVTNVVVPLDWTGTNLTQNNNWTLNTASRTANQHRHSLCAQTHRSLPQTDRGLHPYTTNYPLTTPPGDRRQLVIKTFKRWRHGLNLTRHRGGTLPLPSFLMRFPGLQWTSTLTDPPS